MLNWVDASGEFSLSERQSMLRMMLGDMARRAHGGTFVYPLLWLVVSYFSGWYQLQTELFWVNAAGLVSFSIFRFWVLSKVNVWSEYRPHFARFACCAVILVNALYMGAVAALTITGQAWVNLQIPYLLLICGVAASGTTLFSIDPYVRYLFPSVCVLPVVVTLSLSGREGSALIVVLCLVFIAYLVSMSQTIYRDYWRALKTSLLLEKKAMELRRLSVTDPLTQLFNRLYFEEMLDHEWRRAIRGEQSLALLIIDLDHFKDINDNYGHNFGDQCLQYCARKMQACLGRAGDVVARFGGEEFIVLLPATDSAGALVVANKIREAINSEDLLADGRPVRISASVGAVALTPMRSDDPDALLRRADKALYRAKSAGRNRVEVAAESVELGV